MKRVWRKNCEGVDTASGLRLACLSYTKDKSSNSAIALTSLVENLVIVEIKCVETIHPVHEAQLLSYLRLSGKNVGLLINFYVDRLKDGIKRMVDGRDWDK